MRAYQIFVCKCQQYSKSQQSFEGLWKRPKNDSVVKQFILVKFLMEQVFPVTHSIPSTPLMQDLLKVAQLKYGR